MKSRMLPLLPGLLALLAGSAGASDLQMATPEQQALQTIQAARLTAHVRFLASDLMEGRETGTRGYDLAASYVAAEFERMALIPAGNLNHTSFAQTVPLRKADLVREESSLSIVQGGRSVLLRMNEDFLMSPDYSREVTSVEADVVFVGYGVTAPDLKYDDYAGVDVAGKVVAILDGAPPLFPKDERAHYSSGYMKQQNAVAHGAVGILYFKTPDEEVRTPWDRMVRRSGASGYRWIDEKGAPHDTFAELQCTASLGRSGAEKLFERARPGLQDVFEMHKERNMRSFAIPARVRMKKASRLDLVESSNVAGLLEGSDPELKKQVIVFTAHLDHLGTGPAVKGDTIYNGAYDNAAGTAMLLEIARSLALLPQKPKRSILFLAVTGEEKGLQGSEYFANRPTVPAADIAASINLDMPLLLFPLADVVAIGAEHSSLGPISIQALQDAGLQPGPDPAPEEVIFVRSDQYSFIRKGVPSVFLVSGRRSSDPSRDGAGLTNQWLRSIYHTPQDDLDQEFDWVSGVRLARASLLIGLRTANAPERPVWNPGDFFGRTFGAQQR